MKVYISRCHLLKDELMIVLGEDIFDDIILPRDAETLLIEFFAAYIYMQRPDLGAVVTKAVLDNDISHVIGQVVAGGARDAFLAVHTVHKGHLFLSFELDNIVGALVAVVRLSDNHLIGVVSHCYDAGSTPELSQLIMSTPEFNW